MIGDHSIPCCWAVRPLLALTPLLPLTSDVHRCDIAVSISVRVQIQTIRVFFLHELSRNERIKKKKTTHDKTGGSNRFSLRDQP